MIEISTAIQFFGVSVLLALAPGPDNIFVMTQGVTEGRRAGVLVTLGLCTGLLYHSSIVAFGLVVILKTVPVFFTALKVVGAVYLLYLSWKAFCSDGSLPEAKDGTKRSGWGLFFRGVVMNVTNPKVTIFFFSFLPQFVNDELGLVWVQVLSLGGIFMAATFLTFGLIAVLADSLGAVLFKSQRSRLILDRVAGTVFLLLAINLLVLK